MSSEQMNIAPERNSNKSWMITGGVAVLALLAAAFFLGRGLSGDDTTDTKATPTPFADVSEPALGGESLVVGVSDTDTISVTVDVPATLLVGARSFAVQPQAITADRAWVPTFDGEDTAVWVYGTIINYVVGLSDTEANRALLEQLAPGDQMALVTRNGVNFTFSFNSREQVLVGNPAIYAQQTPGLTLILAGTDGEERLVVNGRYVVDESGGGQQGQGNTVELGEIAQLDDVQITVTGAAYLLDRPEAQPGFAFYLVDYQIQNTGLTALDTSRLGLTLLDESGNQYAVSPLAGQLGNHPALGGYLNASQTALATAGYQIPLGLNSANVHWVVTREDTGAQLQVTIPFSGGAQAAQNAQVTLSEAAISADLTSLILSGQVTNLGDQPLVVSEADILLRTDDGASYLMLSTNPAFPWTVAPGQSVSYSVTFQRPIVAASAVFTVLNQPFQLSNLR